MVRERLQVTLRYQFPVSQYLMAHGFCVLVHYGALWMFLVTVSRHWFPVCLTSLLFQIKERAQVCINHALECDVNVLNINFVLAKVCDCIQLIQLFILLCICKYMSVLFMHKDETLINMFPGNRSDGLCIARHNRRGTTVGAGNMLSGHRCPPHVLCS